MPLSLQLQGAAKSQLVVSLAALLLNDSKVEITSENLNTGGLFFRLKMILFWFLTNA